MTPWNIRGNNRLTDALSLRRTLKVICALVVLACLVYWIALVWGGWSA